MNFFKKIRVIKELFDQLLEIIDILDPVLDRLLKAIASFKEKMKQLKD